MAWAALVFWVCASLPILLFPQLGIEAKNVAVYSIIAQILSPGLAGVLCFNAAGSFPKSHEMRKGWKLLGVGVLLWCLGAVLYSLYPLLNDGQETPYPWYSDIGYLLMYLPCLFAFIFFKQFLNVKVPNWGILLSVIMFCLSLVIAVSLNLEKLGQSDAVLTYLVTLGYILGDPILLGSTIIIASVLKGARQAYPWWFVLAGFVLFYAANVLYTYLTLAGRYSSGGWIDIGWILGFGFIATAAVMTRSLVDEQQS